MTNNAARIPNESTLVNTVSIPIFTRMNAKPNAITNIQNIYSPHNEIEDDGEYSRDA